MTAPPGDKKAKVARLKFKDGVYTPNFPEFRLSGFAPSFDVLHLPAIARRTLPNKCLTRDWKTVETTVGCLNCQSQLRKLNAQAVSEEVLPERTTTGSK